VVKIKYNKYLRKIYSKNQLDGICHYLRSISNKKYHINIAILSLVFSEYDGISKVIKQHIKELMDEGYNVTVFTFESDIASEYKVKIIWCPIIPLLRRVYHLFFFLDIVNFIICLFNLRGYNIIISHVASMNWLAYFAKKLYGASFVYYNHETIIDPNIYQSLIKKIYVKLYRIHYYSIKKADLVISISRYSQRLLKKELDVDSVVIYNKIDINRFYRELDSLYIRKKYNLGTSPVILFVGRLSPHKGVHLLIEVFKLVKQRIPDAKLLIVGKPDFNDYYEYLKKISDNSVIFAGYVPDKELPYYYAACDIYATCSLQEGFNLPLIEAQACGKPVVAFDIGPHREVVGYGYVVDVMDLEKFSNKIVELLNMSERKI